MLDLVTPYNLPIEAPFIELASSRISNTCVGDNLLLTFLLPLVSRNPVSTAWLMLCCAVHHSRFSTRLSVLSPFMWLTCGKLSGFGMNVSAIKRWTLRVMRLPSLYKLTCRYPVWVSDGFNIRPILPTIVPFTSIWYSSKSFIFFIGTKINNNFNTTKI